MFFDNERPIYIQIEEEICRQIARGKLSPGEKMPSLRDMALKIKVNPNTVQRAYRNLEMDGVLFTRRGQGTFVTEDRERVIRLRDKLAEEGARAYLEGARSLGLQGDDILNLIQEIIKREGS